ncbi:MAG TPA: hypothetical protein VHA75_15630 [Rugosimonospora sp.]|nr:hypothetical protein [Rugosimonospora sp.]
MRLVLFTFAGRTENLVIQRPFIDRLLDTYPDSTYEMWDLTRTPEDAEYVRAQDGTHDGRVRVLGHLHPGHPVRCTAVAGRRRGCRCIVHRPPYEKPYAWYAADESYADTVFVKLDDDVLFLETDRFGDLLAPLAEHPNAVVSANVVNNAVCAKHDPNLRAVVQAALKPGDPDDPAADKAWWWLHANPEFARVSHEWYLGRPEPVAGWTRSRPGERISINCIAFTHPTMKRLAAMMAREERLGDEGAVDRLLPRIALGFRVAHLTFGPQDKAMSLAELDDLRARYAAAGKEYLGA